MVWHDHPRDQLISFAVPFQYGVLQNVRDAVIAEVTGTVILIKVDLDAAAMVGVRDLSAAEFRMPSIKHVLRERIGKAKGYELGKSLLVEMRKIAATVPKSRVFVHWRYCNSIRCRERRRPRLQACNAR